MTDYHAYPVLVTYEYRHVRWMEAPDQETAVRRVASFPPDCTSDDETLFSTRVSVAAPSGDFDWEDVYEGNSLMPYQGLNCEAHVEEHRRHLWQMRRLFLEATAEHEDREVAAGRLAEADRRTCGLCPDWLDDDHAGSARHLMSVRAAEFKAREAAAVAG